MCIHLNLNVCPKIIRGGVLRRTRMQIGRMTIAHHPRALCAPFLLQSPSHCTTLKSLCRAVHAKHSDQARGEGGEGKEEGRRSTQISSPIPPPLRFRMENSRPAVVRHIQYNFKRGEGPGERKIGRETLNQRLNESYHVKFDCVSSPVLVSFLYVVMCPHTQTQNRPPLNPMAQTTVI